MDSKAIRNLTNILLDYSLELKEGEIFIINSTYLAEPLLLEIYKEALLRGAHPVLKVTIPDAGYVFFKYANEKQVTFIPPWAKEEVKNASAFLNIMAVKNAKALRNADPEKMKLSNIASREILEIFQERETKGELRWCVTLYPTDGSAQEAEMSLQEFEDFVVSAGHLDLDDPVAYWKDVDRTQEKIVKYLETKKEIRIIADNTDLRLDIQGRKWINASGKRNFPDGEVFTSPIENGINGWIKFNLPQYYMGKEVSGVYLEFKGGLIVKYHADKGVDFLEKILESDEGAKRLGELAFGLNYGIKHVTKNVLFDEKIGGTVHLAVGRGFPEAGGINKSVVHWDMILDMRDGGEIYADGELIYKDGRFIVEL
ncbi:MAG: aminopeptidase [candidate division WOR-3 bacterium]